MSNRHQQSTKQGYVKVKSKNLGKWSKRWLVVRSASRGAATDGSCGARLEKYRDETAAQQNTQPPTVYQLSQLQYINRLRESTKHRIYLVFTDYTSLQFAADSELEADNWLQTIQQQLSANTTRHDFNEMFHVYLMKSSRLPTHGECLLQVEADSVRLLDIDDPRHVQLTWTLNSVRRYSIERGMFVLEVGRASATGEGVFVFECKEPDTIYDNVDRAARALAIASRQQRQNVCVLPSNRNTGPVGTNMVHSATSGWSSGTRSASDGRQLRTERPTIATNTSACTSTICVADSVSVGVQSAQDAGYYSAKTLNTAPCTSISVTPPRSPSDRSQYQQDSALAQGQVRTGTSSSRDVDNRLVQSDTQNVSSKQTQNRQHRPTEDYSEQDTGSRSAAATVTPGRTSAAHNTKDYQLPTTDSEAELCSSQCSTSASECTTVDMKQGAGGGGGGSRRGRQTATQDASSGIEDCDKRLSVLSTGTDDYDQPITVQHTVVGSNSQYRQPSIVSQATQSQPTVQRKTVSQGTTTCDEIVEDQQDKELSNAIYEMMQQVGLRSLIVDRIELQ